jgi:hypothetical protein
MNDTGKLRIIDGESPEIDLINKKS